jgi:tRNA-splicing ligase RtcB
MAESILLVLGANYNDCLPLAPRGAGREISRSALWRKHPGEDVRREAMARATQGLNIRWYCGKPDLSETPIAYKNAAQVKV